MSSLVITKMTKRKDMESLRGHLGVSMKVISRKISDTDLESCGGLMVPVTKANGSREFSAAKENCN